MAARQPLRARAGRGAARAGSEPAVVLAMVTVIIRSRTFVIPALTTDRQLAKSRTCSDKASLCPWLRGEQTQCSGTSAFRPISLQTGFRQLCGGRGRGWPATCPDAPRAQRAPVSWQREVTASFPEEALLNICPSTRRHLSFVPTGDAGRRSLGCDPSLLELEVL